MSKTEIIAKGVCSYPQTEGFVKARQYIIIEENGKRYLLVKLSNLRGEKVTGVTLYIEQFDETGRKISADKIRLKNICGYPKKSFAVKHKISIASDCVDCKITVTEAEFDGYTFTPHNLEKPSYRIDPPAPVAPIVKAGAKGVKVEPRTLKMPVLLIIVSVLSLLIAFVAIAVQTSLFARNSDSFLQNGVRYGFANGDNSDGSDIYVIGYKGNFETVNIPEKIEGHRVAGIAANAFRGNGKVRSVTIRGSVSVGAEAFYDCGSLKSINLENATSIGAKAFYGCGSLEQVDLKRAVGVGDNAFAYCKMLKSVKIAQDDAPIDLGEYAFAGCSALETVEIGRPIGFRSVQGAEINIFSESYGVKELSLKSFECGDGAVSRTVHDLFGVNVSDGAMLSLRSFYVDTLDVFGSNMFSGMPIETVRIGYIEQPVVRENAFYGCKNMTELVLNEKITEIGVNAFYDCGIKNLNVDALESVGDGAFYGSGLEVFDLSRNTVLESIGAKAFEGSRLTQVYIPQSVKSISPYAFADCTQLVKAEFSERSAIPFIAEYMFSGCNRLSEVTLPNGIGYIYGGAFGGCKSLTSIELPQNLLRIFDNAFYGAGLTTLYIPDSVENVGNAAFGDCKSLAQISVPFIGGESERNNNFSYIFGTVPSSLKQVTVRGDGDTAQFAFGGCADIERVEFTGNVESIGAYAFSGCSALESVVLPDGLKNIGAYAFAECSSLETLVVPQSVEYMGRGILNGCASLSALSVPFVGINSYSSGTLADMYAVDYALIGIAAQNLERVAVTDTSAVAEGAFNGCFNLREAELCDSLVSIGSYAFNGCRKLNTVHIPRDVGYIGSQAFFGCYRLYEVYNYSELNIVAGSPDNGYVAYYALAVHGDKSDKLTKVEQNGFEFVYGEGAWHLVGYPEKSERIVLPSIVDAGGHSFDRYEIYDRLFYGDVAVKDIVVPTSVTRIGEQTFSDCAALESVTLSNGITSIGSEAFSGCASLREINLPQGITEISDGLFKNCFKLESVGAPSRFKRIGEQAFYNCAKLRAFDIARDCAEIGDRAFYGCRALKRIVLPEQLGSIGESAFVGCIKLYDVCNLSRLTVTAGSYANGGAALYAYRVFTDEKERLPYLIEEGVYYVATDGWHAVDYYGDDGNVRIERFVIGDTATDSITVDAYAFENNENIESVYIDTAVARIGEYAFTNCCKLAEVTADIGALVVSNYAFTGAPVTSFAARGGALTLMPRAMYGSGSGMNFEFNGEMVTVNEYAFENSDLSKLEMSGTAFVSSDGAFARCTSLGSVSLEFATDVALNERTFEGCPNLASVSVRGGNTEIARNAFYGNASLANVSINGNDVHFSSSAFTYAPSGKLAVSGNAIVFDGSSIGGGANLTLEISGSSVTLEQSALLCGVRSASITATGNVEIKRNGINYSEGGLTIRGNAVTVADNAFENKAVGSLELVGRTAAIGASAFAETGTTSVIIEVDDLIIKGEAFSGCGALNVLKLSAGKTAEIGERAFYGCSDLRTLVLPSSLRRIEDSTFASCYVAETIDIPSGVIYIGDRAFEGCSNVRRLVIPQGVRSLGTRVFAECYNLESLDLGSVTTIGEQAFVNCGTLATLELPSALASIGEYAFGGCYSLRSLEIPRSVTRLGGGAFSGCANLRTLVLSSADIPYYAFNNCAVLTSLDIPSGVASIGSNAFLGCSALERLTLPDSLQRIESSAFYDCGSLVSLAVPSGVTAVADGAFANCSSLKELVLPSGLKTIGQNAFSGCGTLAALELPDGVVSIGSYAFFDCGALAELKLPSSLATIGSNAFQNCAALENLELPDSVTAVGAYAFDGGTSLASLKLSENLTNIGAYSFARCESLTALAIPRQLRNIQSNAFQGATRLFSVYNASTMSITAGSSSYGNVAQYAIEVTRDRLYNPEFVAIGEYEFTRLKSDWYLTRYSSSMTSAILPSDVKVGADTIASYAVHKNAFRSALNYVMIPAAVKKITSGAFANTIRSVYYEGAEGNWNSHRISSDPDTYYNFGFWSVYFYDKCAHNGNEWRWDGGMPVDRDIDRGEWIIAKPPTCTEDGERHKICTECDSHVYDMQSIPMLGHDYNADGECTQCGHIRVPLEQGKE